MGNPPTDRILYDGIRGQLASAKNDILKTALRTYVEMGKVFGNRLLSSTAKQNRIEELKLRLDTTIEHMLKKLTLSVCLSTSKTQANALRMVYMRLFAGRVEDDNYFGEYYCGEDQEEEIEGEL